MPLMHLVLATLAISQTPAIAPPIDPCDSALIAQTRTALADLRETANAVGQGGSVVSVVYEGFISVEGHLMRPGTTRTVPVRLEITEAAESASGSSIVLREVAGSAGAEHTETCIVRNGRVARQRSSTDPFSEVVGTAASRDDAELSAWLPYTSVRAALRAAPSCRPGPPVEYGGKTLTPVTFTNSSGQACSLLLDADHRINGVETLAAHQRLGDICQWTRFQDWTTEDGITVPRRISRFFVLDDATERYDLNLASVSRSPASSAAFDLPESHRQDIPTWGLTQTTDQGMTFITLASSVWSVEIGASNSRVLVIERAADLVLLGAPDGDAVCGSLLRALEARFPNKPVRQVAVSHHHPSPSGGLRSIAAAGAAIVVPKAMEPYVRELLARPVTLGLPAVAGPAAPSLITFERSTTIQGGEVSVQVLDLGEHSAHAFCYAVFYIPELGVLFEDDLGYFPADGSFRVGPRLAGLAEQVAAAGIEPKRLIPGWPVKNAAREVPWSAIAARAAAEPAKQPAGDTSSK
jgi:glyoxylase-like metal-dependent hydrolase (beta-lactamase superfamily II)